MLVNSLVRKLNIIGSGSSGRNITQKDRFIEQKASDK